MGNNLKIMPLSPLNFLKKPLKLKIVKHCVRGGGGVHMGEP